MFCTNCGEKLPDNAKTCPKCGAPAEEAAPAAAPAPAAAAKPARGRFCKGCGAKLKRSETVCPYCGAKNRIPITKRFWFWAILLLLAALGLFYLFTLCRDLYLSLFG